MKNKSNQSGFSTLLLILVLSLMLELMLFSMLLVTRTSTVRAFSTSYSQESYFAAEGVLHDTLYLLRTKHWDSKNSTRQELRVSDVTVWRTVTYNQATHTYHVEIESEFKEAKRKLVADFTPQNDIESKKDLDVVFVLDTSESMKSTIAYLKNAVTDLIDDQGFTSADRVAVVSFAKTASVVQPFSSDFQQVKDSVRSLQLSSDTNFTEALHATRELFLSSGRPEAAQIVVFFSDGVPTFTTTTKNKPYYCATTCFDPHFGNSYAPDNGGSYCTNDAIDAASDFHATNTTQVYAVFFARNTGGSCQNIEKSQQLGRLTLQQIVGDRTHYFETSQISELKGIFQSIGKNISETKLQYSYREVVPE